MRRRDRCRIGARLREIATALSCALTVLGTPGSALAQLQPVWPRDQRGRVDAERSGVHDAANLRTLFYNFGMVGGYPPDPLNVDLSVFHSVEVPKGTGMNYSDGITPFVLTPIRQRDGEIVYIMETGFRERQGISPSTNRQMRFEPRPGFFQADPAINRGRSPAMSHDPRTWPTSWPDKVNDPDDPGWSASWNGYFGKRAAADQESFTVMDDDLYDAFQYSSDSRDTTRLGLGLRVEVRGFQWANPQAGNVIFWHYDIINESTTDYDSVIFGLYMDSGVGGSANSCDRVAESDDDNAFFDKTLGLNLVYTWDNGGHGVDLSGTCSPTGYLGYAYLETPGNALDGIDNDSDGITDERREGGAGTQIVGKEAILAAAAARYDTVAFQRVFGPIRNRPAYVKSVWWTGDEDMDWDPEFNDVGADGVENTGDTGELDGMPTFGEPNFDRTDLNESDQIGLTGFKLSRIRGPEPLDNVIFFTDDQRWPQKLYEQFTNPVASARFDLALAQNYNIAFLFASGPFALKAGQNERFSLALAYGADLTELRTTVRTVQQIYDANYQFAVPPPMPTVHAEAGTDPTGRGYVRLSWDDVAERGSDPVTYENDFQGYRIYRATDPNFLDPRVIRSGRGTSTVGVGKPIAQFDVRDTISGYSTQIQDGVAYWLGTNSGIAHTWTDTTVTNGQLYYYAVVAYDRGVDLQRGGTRFLFYPSENAVTVSRTPRGGTILPKNVVSVRPDPRVLGYQPARVTDLRHVTGIGQGTVDVLNVNSALVPQGHLFHLTFTTPDPDSIAATRYFLRDSTSHELLISLGTDLKGLGSGPTASGLLPIVSTDSIVRPDSARSGYAPGSTTNTRAEIQMFTTGTVPFGYNRRRPFFPDSIRIVFDDVVVDTSIVDIPGGFRSRLPAKFRVYAQTASGDQQLDFRFKDSNNDQTLSAHNEVIDVVTYEPSAPTTPVAMWRVAFDTTGQGARGPIDPPSLGDVYELKLKLPYGADDAFTFTTSAERIDASVASAQAQSEKPYVVPNPYLASASFEPERFAVSGRGERRMEFRNLPPGAVIRIYTVRGSIVQTLRHDGSTVGFVAWNLRTRDNLDVAPGLYVFNVEAPGVSSYVGKFAVIK